MVKRYLDEMLSGFLCLPEGPRGCVCLCARRHEALYEGSFGVANVEKGTPIAPDTVFRIFSLTKLVVCTAAMMLYERGKFLLDDPISDYFPEYASSRLYVPGRDGGYTTREAEQIIRVRHAFTMTCGLPYDIAGHTLSPLMIARTEALAKELGWNYNIVEEVRAMADIPLFFEPGTHWLYGYGHELVAGLTQLLAGKPLHQFLQEEIFEPLGMRDTGYRYRADHRQRMCTLYKPDGKGGVVPSEGPRDRFHEPDANFDMGSAGLYATPRDYLAFTQMLANGGVTKDGRRLLSRRTIDMMRTNQLSGDALADYQQSNGFGYGYGYGVRTRLAGPGYDNVPVGEFGWSGWCGSWASIDPSSGFSCVYMHQLLPDQAPYCHPRVRAAVYSLFGE